MVRRPITDLSHHCVVKTALSRVQVINTFHELHNFVTAVPALHSDGTDVLELDLH